jgi:hypothetical protein
MLPGGADMLGKMRETKHLRMEWRPMTIRILAWYISAMLWLVCLMLSLITFVPGSERGRLTAQGAFATGALAFAVLGLASSLLSAHHWINRSRALWIVLLSAASVCTLAILALVG